MGPVRALDVHFLGGELGLSSNAILRGPELLPWLGLLSVLGNTSAWTVHLVAGYLCVKTVVKDEFAVL